MLCRRMDKSGDGKLSEDEFIKVIFFIFLNLYSFLTSCVREPWMMESWCWCWILCLSPWPGQDSYHKLRRHSTSKNLNLKGNKNYIFFADIKKWIWRFLLLELEDWWVVHSCIKMQLQLHLINETTKNIDFRRRVNNNNKSVNQMFLKICITISSSEPDDFNYFHCLGLVGETKELK